MSIYILDLNTYTILLNPTCRIFGGCLLDTWYMSELWFPCESATRSSIVITVIIVRYIRFSYISCFRRKWMWEDQGTPFISLYLPHSESDCGWRCSDHSRGRPTRSLRLNPGWPIIIRSTHYATHSMYKMLNTITRGQGVTQRLTTAFQSIVTSLSTTHIMHNKWRRR